LETGLSFSSLPPRAPIFHFQYRTSPVARCRTMPLTRRCHQAAARLPSYCRPAVAEGIFYFVF
jgi:hypothetical protein